VGGVVESTVIVDTSFFRRAMTTVRLAVAAVS
jgi:hypothetical protein